MTVEELRRGTRRPLEPLIDLRAGALTAELVGIELRHLRGDGVELVRGIYAAVRDEAWGTVANEVTEKESEIGADAFLVRFAVRCERPPIVFSWSGEISGSSAGEITYAMRGSSGAAFRYCRIGLNVLHPPAFAGSAFEARGGSEDDAGALPHLIEPVRIEDGVFIPLVRAYDEIAFELDGGRLELVFEGDLFEMEDQRNWTDGSFKTYSTPAALGNPLECAAGQRFAQRVTVRVVPS
ncbi:MAG: hypothetical protein ACRDNG_07225 [Gaiellaceae bacterium]